MIVQGNRDLLTQELAVILNSSQSKTPCARDGWVMSTMRAAGDMLKAGRTLVTSLGLLTWELVLYLVARGAGNQVIVSPYIDDDGGKNIFEKTIDDFSLDPARAAMVFVAPEPGSSKAKATWMKRDRAAVNLAGLIVPVSIRPGGKLQYLMETEGRGKRIISDYTTNFDRPIIRPRRYEKEAVAFDPDRWDFVTHWTRTHHGPWPGQKKEEFYESLIKSENEYPNNAFNTIRSIAANRMIKASSNRLRAGIRGVAFTESHPADVLSRLRWLPKRVNWNFEPYGLAIEKKTARKMGIRPVIYGDQAEYDRLPASDRPYFQSRGQRDVDWSSEKEWRHIGDLDFSDLEDDRLVFLVWSRLESSIMEKESGSRIITLSRE